MAYKIGFPSFSSDSNLPSNLLAGSFPVDDINVTLLGGQAYAEGTVLGKISSGPNAGKWTIATLSNTANPPVATADGSQTPRAILSFDVDATGGDQNASAFRSGDFDINLLVLGTGFTTANIQDAFGSATIFLKNVTPTY